MFKIFRGIFVVFLVVLACSVLWAIPSMAATNYYVSSSTGNDNNNGTSSSTPWRTLEKASTITYQAGDQILLRCGDSWNGQFNLNGSGTSAAPITLASYGTGNKPKLCGNWPALAAVQVNNNGAGISYSGNWVYSGGWSGYYNNDFTYSCTANDYVQFMFTGTSVSWIGPTGSNEGKADVYIDNTLYSTVDLYSADNVLQKELFTASGLYTGSHTIKIVVRSDKNPLSSNYNVLIDAFHYSDNACGILVGTPLGIKIKDLELSNYMVGIYAYSGVNTNLNYLWMENLYIHDCPDNDGFGALNEVIPTGIAIQAGNTGQVTSLSGITIKNSTLENCTNGIVIQGNNACNIKDVNISGITGIDCGSCPINLTWVDTADITNCISVHCATENWVCGTCAGFNIYCKNVNWINCEFADTQRNNCNDGTGYDYEGANDNVKFDKCLFHDTKGAAIMLYGNPSCNTNVEIKNSVFYNDSLDCYPLSAYGPSGEIAILTGSHTGSIHDNKFYKSDNVNALGGANIKNCPDLGFLNNLILKENNESNGLNYASSATISASSNSTSAANVKDGNISTAWSAASAANEWLELDFNTQLVNKLVVKESGSNIKWFQVQYWDSVDSTWRSCFNGYGIGQKRVMPIVPVTTSKLRILVNNTYNGNPSIAEFEAYNCTGGVTVNDTGSGITYSGNWAQNTGASGYINNDYRYSNTANDYVQYTFTGTSISWIGPMGSNQGMADVYIDNVFQRSIDLYNISNPLQAELFTKTGLAYGTHTIKIVVRGDKNPSSSASNVLVDAFLYSTANKVTVNNTDAGITYSGNWVQNTGASGYINNDYRYSNTANNYVQYTFTGTSISWIGPMGSNQGKADVYIDNVFQSTVDLYSGSYPLQLELYTKTGLTNGTHTIKIVVREDKNSSSSAYNVLLDAFQYQ